MALFGKGITVASGFDLAGNPVDSKYIVDTLSEANEFVDAGVAYEGMQIYCLEDKTIYVYNGSTFQTMSASSGSAEVDLSNYVTLNGAQTITGKKTFTETIEGNAKTASKLAEAKTISVSGDASGSTSFDGSANATIAVTLADSGVTAGEYAKVTVDAKGRVTQGAQLEASDIPELTLAKITDAGSAAGKDVGASAGNVPILGADGKLDTNILPALAISTTHVVASQAEMLALTVQEGDMAVRTDLSASFVFKGGDSTKLENWIRLASPSDNGFVATVNGKTGTVTLTTSDIAEGSNLYYTEERATANFTTNVSTTNVSALADGANVVMKDDTIILDCGNA